MKALPGRAAGLGRRGWRVGASLLLLGGWLAATLGGLWPCPTAALVGVPCPGCGLTRATLAALTGDFAAAWRLHPLFALLAPVTAAGLLYAIALIVKGEEALTPLRRVRQEWLLAGMFLLVLLSLGVWVTRFFGAFGGPVSVS